VVNPARPPTGAKYSNGRGGGAAKKAARGGGGGAANTRITCGGGGGTTTAGAGDGGPRGTNSGACALRRLDEPLLGRPPGRSAAESAAPTIYGIGGLGLASTGTAGAAPDSDRSLLLALVVGARVEAP